MAALLDKAAIAAAQDGDIFEDVEVPEWGGTVRIRVMTGRERDAWEASLMTRKGKRMEFTYTNYRASLLVRCIVDEDGKRLFGDHDIGTLSEKSAPAIERLFEAARKINRLNDEDVEEMTQDFLKEESDGGPMT